MKKEIKFLEKYYLEFEKLITNEHFKNTINLKNQILKIKIVYWIVLRQL